MNNVSCWSMRTVFIGNTKEKKYGTNMIYMLNLREMILIRDTCIYCGNSLYFSIKIAALFLCYPLFYAIKCNKLTAKQACIATVVRSNRPTIQIVQAIKKRIAIRIYKLYLRLHVYFLKLPQIWKPRWNIKIKKSQNLDKYKR